LDRGADDYLTKPFGVEELLARVRVALRHSASAQGVQPKVIRAGALTIDLVRHITTRGAEEVKLTGTEYKLLSYLASNHGRVLTHQSILVYVWGPADAEHTEYLRVYMRQLRKKLEDDPERPQHILTEPGIGYRFIADE
jgi:two-component system KDP operon response regulator KdpE